MKSARQVVAESLYKMHIDQAWSNLVFDSGLHKNPLGARDSAFAAALFYGVLERQITLDACIAEYSSVKIRKISPAVLAILRMGIYQILYMDSVPDSAAVAESVELSRLLKQHKSSGFINAILRSFLRGNKQIPYPKDCTREEHLAIEFSCPAQLISMWLTSYGEDMTLRILKASLGRPPLNIRVNTCLTTPAELSAELNAKNVDVHIDKDLPECLALKGTGAAHRLPKFDQGHFHIQDKSSQLCALALDVAPGMRVLDSCAAPGGKSFTLAQIMQNNGEIVATDLHPHRVDLIKNRAAQMGLNIIKAHKADMTQYNPELGSFDRVLCDVPCSGLGVIRRKPEIKYKSLEEFSEIPIL